MFPSPRARIRNSDGGVPVASVVVNVRSVGAVSNVGIHPFRFAKSSRETDKNNVNRNVYVVDGSNPGNTPGARPFINTGAAPRDVNVVAPDCLIEKRTLTPSMGRPMFPVVPSTVANANARVSCTDSSCASTIEILPVGSCSASVVNDTGAVSVSPPAVAVTVNAYGVAAVSLVTLKVALQPGERGDRVANWL